MSGLERIGGRALEVVLVERTDHAVVVADADGVIRFWNPAAAAMFGHSEADALGRTLDLIIPDKLRDRHWEGYRQVVATGDTAYAGRTLAVPALRADATRISVELTVTLLQEGDGAIAGIAAIIRDVTEQWEERRSMQRRVAEVERALADRGTGAAE